METASDHEVEDEPKIAIKADGDALTNAAEGADGKALGGGDGWVGGAEEEDTGEAYVLEGLAEDAGLERGEVGGDVGEFRH
jgi:hypothetical protein